MSLFAPVAAALETSALEVRSYFDEPLRVEIDLAVPPGASVEARLADYEAFERAGLNRDELAIVVEVSIEASDSGNPRVVLATQAPVREPALALLLALRIDGEDRQLPVEFLLDRAPSARIGITRERPAGTPGTVRAQGGRPSPAATTRTYGPTVRFDTLYAIAAKVRPSRRISVRAMAMALFEANPHAFFANNINNLRRGVMLSVPPVGVTHAANRQREGDFQRQMDAWRGAATATRVSPGSATGRSASESGAPPTPRPAPARRSAALASTTSDEALTAELEAEIAAQAKARAEFDASRANLRSRLAALDARVAEVRAVLEAHSERFDALRGELAARGQSVVLPSAAAGGVGQAPAKSSRSDNTLPTTTPVPAGEAHANAGEAVGSNSSNGNAGLATTRSPVPGSPVSGAAADMTTVAEPAPIAQSSARAASGAGPQAAPRPRAEARPTAVPVPRPPATRSPDTSPLAFVTSLARDLTGGSGRLVVAGLALVVALLAGWMVARGLTRRTRQARADRNHERSEAGLRSQVSEKAARSVQEAARVTVPAARPESTGTSDDTHSTLNVVDPELAVAPVDDSMQALFREVDVYVAYGRFEDAATRLQQAIEDAPGDYELRAKLGEILYEAGRTEEFIELARSLYLRLQEGADENLWARVALLGQRLAPDERLFEQTLRAPARRQTEADYDGVDELAERRHRHA